MSEAGFNRFCDRCGRDIHDLEPATGMNLGGAVEVKDLLVCNDCIKEFVEWWESLDKRRKIQIVDVGDGDGGDSE